MLNIVILGGGVLGRHIASILSKERHKIIVIDHCQSVIEEIASSLDVATRLGSGTNWEVLDDLLEFHPDIFIALTGDDETNMVACTIAKKLNYPRTIARIRSNHYFNLSRIDFATLFNIDELFNPEILSANAIMKYIRSTGSLAVEYFAYGALELRTISIPETWKPPRNATLKQIKLPEKIIASLIHRIDKSDPDNPVSTIIFPHGNDIIMPGDEVTFIGATDAMREIKDFFGIEKSLIRSVTIAGGSDTAQYLSQQLVEQGIDVRIIEKNYDKCTILSERLPNCTILNHDAEDKEFLASEKIAYSDLFIAMTGSDSSNLLICLLGKDIGCKECMMLVQDNNYIPMINKLGFKYALSPLVTATNNILSQLIFGKVSSLVSLYENQAEVMEIKVSHDSRLIGIPLAELGPYLPKDLLIVMIQNRGRIVIAHGNHIISPGDTVIVVTSPAHVDELERIF